MNFRAHFFLKNELVFQFVTYLSKSQPKIYLYCLKNKKCKFTKNQKMSEPLNRPAIPADKELGFGITDVRQKRLINPDGTYNYKRMGLPWYETFNFYKWIISTKWRHFILIIFFWYTVVNILFVMAYYLVGVDQIGGMLFNNAKDKFWEIYFFSSQTLTTVGYGRINPTGFGASAIASFEALVGLSSFAIITGLLFARFAKAPDIVMYADKAMIAPFVWNSTELPSVMIRAANRVNSSLMNVRAQINLNMLIFDENGIGTRKFFALTLERETVMYFPTTWTLVHPIDEKSPLYGYTFDNLQRAKPELLILISGFDETFDQNIFSRRSYAFEELQWGGKYIRAFYFEEDGQGVLNLGKLHHYEKAQIDHLVAEEVGKN